MGVRAAGAGAGVVLGPPRAVILACSRRGPHWKTIRIVGAPLQPLAQRLEFGAGSSGMEFFSRCRPLAAPAPPSGSPARRKP